MSSCKIVSDYLLEIVFCFPARLQCVRSCSYSVDFACGVHMTVLICLYYFSAMMFECCASAAGIDVSEVCSNITGLLADL